MCYELLYESIKLLRDNGIDINDLVINKTSNIKEYQRTYQKQYYLKNKKPNTTKYTADERAERIKEYQRRYHIDYYYKNKERIRQYQNEYYQRKQDAQK